MSTPYLVAAIVGLLSALHCIGMCGGIVGALIFSLPPSRRGNRGHLLCFILAYNLGRVMSYALAGALFGWAGAAILSIGVDSGLPRLLRVLAASVTIGIGLHVAGWFPRFAFIERLGEPLWRRLEPLGRRLLPVDSLPRALLYGALWGWLPCGLVYAMLLGAPAQSSPTAGAVYMALFGLGTLPVMIAVSLLTGRLYGIAGSRSLQALGGLTVVALGLFTLLTQQL